MPRKVRMTVCSSCLNDFPDKELYTVGKQGTAADGEIGYYTPYCKSCVKKYKDNYNKVIKEPKTSKSKK